MITRDYRGELTQALAQPVKKLKMLAHCGKVWQQLELQQNDPQGAPF